MLQLEHAELCQRLEQELKDNPAVALASNDGAAFVSLEKHRDIDEYIASPDTLRDHVAGQISLSAFTPQEQLSTGELAAHLDNTGHLQVNLSKLAERFNVPEADVERVLASVQCFHASHRQQAGLKREHDQREPAGIEHASSQLQTEEIHASIS
ncbi:hypothetical protein [Microvirga tunisiensis]|uniref:RNA polymerase factor sigma-54 n=1 Tax=Microvirga tunisiensis TaxID=2108360 RepID=UPI001FCE6DE2|nr:hypothetical protein [Microvirga tunisiensis]